jgi:hypothetical protein
MKFHGAFRRDLIGAILALVLAGAYGYGASQIHKSSLIGKGVGADALPKGLAITLAVLAVILIVQAFVQRRKDPATAAPPTPEKKAEARHKHLRAGGMLLIGIGFLALVEYIGYIPAIFLMICATAVYNGRPMSWQVAGVAAGLTAVFYGLFDLVLHIPMPSGIWPHLWRAIGG